MVSQHGNSGRTGRVASNELERVWGSARAPAETQASLEGVRPFLEHERRLRKNRRRKYSSLSLQRPAIFDGLGAMATGRRETAHSSYSAVEPVFSAVPFV